MITLSDGIFTPAPKPADAKAYVGPLLDFKTKDELLVNGIFEGARVQAFESGVWKEYRYLGANIFEEIVTSGDGNTGSISGYESETIFNTGTEDVEHLDFNPIYLDEEKTQVFVNGLRIINYTDKPYYSIDPILDDKGDEPQSYARITFVEAIESGDCVQLIKHK